MKSRPLPFILLSIFFVCVAAGLYVQASISRGIGLVDFGGNMRMLSPMNWLCLFSLLLNAFLTYNVFGILKYTLPTQVILMAYNNYLACAHSPLYTPLQTALATLAFAAVAGLCLYKGDAWNLLRRPNLRWWATAPRYERNLPVMVHSRSVKNMRAKTHDVSMTGAFLCSLDNSWNVKVDEEVILTIEALGFECKARVVRITFGKGNYPEGVGVHFTAPSDHAKNLLKYFISGRPENLLGNAMGAVSPELGTRTSRRDRLG